MSKNVYSNVLEAIGHTPMIRLNNVAPGSKHTFWAKVEYFNPAGSVKDRVAVSIIEDAEKKGLLKKGGTIIEATSGNTGLGLAMVAAVKGYKTIFVMPDKISEEKRAILRAYGAQVVITPTAVEPEDPRSYLSVAKKLVEITPGALYSNQFNNPANPKKHLESTGPEIWEQMDGKVDVFVAGGGTGGTISGVGRFLKGKNSKIQVVLADPVGSILYDLYYHKKVINPPKPYKVEGVGEDMLPDNVHFDVMDGVVSVDDKSAFSMTRKLVAEEGLCLGPSSAMALVAAIEWSKKLTVASNIVVLFPDNGRGYLSKVFNDQWMQEFGFLESPSAQKKISNLISDLKISSRKRAHLDVGMSIKEAAQSLSAAGVMSAAVMSGGKIVGCVSERDLRLGLQSGRVKSENPIIHLVVSQGNPLSADAPVNTLDEVFTKSMIAFVGHGKETLEIHHQDYLEYLTMIL